MKTNIATTFDQSARLLRCGVSADTADMFYQTPITVSQKATREDMLLVRKADETLFDTDIPAWSLSRLLELLPRTVTFAGRTGLIGLWREREEDGGEWTCSCPGIVYYVKPTPFEAVIKLIEWLMKRGYKLNEI